MHVAVHQLKAGLSRYLALARAGDAITVTFHNKPVARLTGLPHFGAGGVARLIDSGAAQWSGGKPALQPALQLTGKAGKTVAEAVLEDRG